MPETSSASSSSPSSCVSFSSFDEEVVPAVTTTDDGVIKLVCSYGGKIMPRRHDGKLRYVGGHTRVLAVHGSVSFHGLYRKVLELCGWDAVTVRCQLPTEDMDALISVTSDDDFTGVLDEYDAAAARRGPLQRQLRVRVFLSLPAGGMTPLTPPPTLVANRRRRSRHLLVHAATRAALPRADVCVA